MKLTSKWILWFVLVAVYASIIGGLFYYNLFKFVFDRKLQNEMIESVRFRTQTLVEKLTTSPREVSFAEAEIMKSFLNNDDRIKGLIYLNYDGSIRWHKNTEFLKMSYQDYNNQVGFETNAPVQAIEHKQPRAILASKGDAYDMAIPIIAKCANQRDGSNTCAVGVVDMMVSRVDAKKLIHTSMKRYAIGAVIMMLLIGGVLYLFLLLKIIRPLEALKDSIEAVSLNNLALDFTPRRDEIGDVAQAISTLMTQINTEIKGMQDVEIMSLEKEERWWKTILAVTVPRGSRAMVMDENNNVLYANFELKIPGKTRVHLLDIFDGRQQEIIQVIGEALEHPKKVLRSSVSQKDVKFVVKAVQLPDDAGKSRIVLVLEPEKGK